jgi:hypothetical protein
VSLFITAEQRNALYDQILDRLARIGDIEMAIQAGKFDAAERMGQEFSDDLRLLVNDLGFGEGEGKPVELTSPPAVLRRALPRLRDLSAGHSDSHKAEFAELRPFTFRIGTGHSATPYELRGWDSNPQPFD